MKFTHTQACTREKALMTQAKTENTYCNVYHSIILNYRDIVSYCASRYHIIIGRS